MALDQRLQWVGSTRKELKRIDDAISGTLLYMTDRLGVTQEQLNKIEVLMRLSYRRGKLAEAVTHARYDGLPDCEKEDDYGHEDYGV